MTVAPQCDQNVMKVIVLFNFYEIYSVVEDLKVLPIGEETNCIEYRFFKTSFKTI